MTEERLEFGKKGERAAVKFLKKKGYKILEKNYRSPLGEIDIVAEQNKVLVFVEVKTRTGQEFGHPFTAVHPGKQKKILQVARSFLAKHKIQDREIRFDVIAVSGAPDQPKSWDIELLQDAFRL